MFTGFNHTTFSQVSKLCPTFPISTTHAFLSSSVVIYLTRFFRFYWIHVYSTSLKVFFLSTESIHISRFFNYFKLGIDSSNNIWAVSISSVDLARTTEKYLKSIAMFFLNWLLQFYSSSQIFEQLFSLKSY